ncbi:hypothetical protein [Arthrobacter sp. H14]|nr:hypothetical protein [Arthrobacter sp. H14]
MNTNKRIIAASAAVVAGLFLPACDNTETEQPTETTAPADEGDTGTGGY